MERERKGKEGKGREEREGRAKERREGERKGREREGCGPLTLSPGSASDTI